MKRDLAVRVKTYIADRGRRRRLLALVCALSVVTSLGVYGALMRPAIGMEKDNPLLTAEVTDAVFGDELTARVTATAVADLEETYFYLAAETDRAGLADAVSFDGEGIAQVSTRDGGVLALRRDGEKGCWFTLERGRSVSFDLTYRFAVGESAGETPPSAAASVRLRAGSERDLPAARAAAGERAEPALTLTWMTRAELDALAETGPEETEAQMESPMSGQSAYAAPGLLEKQASADGVIAWNKDYTSGDLAVDYDAVNGQMYYRLMVNMSEFTGDTIEVTDVLPAGAVLVNPADGTPAVVAKLYGNKEWQVSSFSYNAVNGDPAGTYVMAEHTKTTIETDGTMKIVLDRVDKIRIGNHGVGSPITIAIYYKLSFAGDPAWGNLGNKSKTYINQAAWNGSAAVQRTIVSRAVPNVVKSGAQVPQTNPDGSVKLGNNGQPVMTNRVRYRVLINPAGLDLAAGTDTVVVRDVLTTQAEASLLADSVQLCRYDAAKPDGLGAAIDRDQYRFSYDAPTHTAVFTLPDGTPCVLVYDYLFDRGALTGGVDVRNTATLQGNLAENGTANVKLAEGGAPTASGQGTVTVCKVDSGDYSKRLPGAVFSLMRYSAVDGVWDWRSAADGPYVTNADGKLVLENAPDQVLCRLTETEAPAGYRKSGAAYYFVWMADGKTKAETISAMTPAAFGGISADQVRFVSGSGAEVYVPNECTSISVKKLWRDESGSAAAPGADSVALKLWRQARKLDGCTVTVNVTTASGSFSASQVVAKGSRLTIAVNAWWPSTYSVTIAGQTSAVNQSNGRAVLANLSSVSSDMTVAVRTTEYLTSLPFEFSGYTDPTAITGVGSPEQVADTPILLSAGNHWTWSKTDLPKTDAAGNAYYYWVEETVPAGSAVSYLNNGGIQTGDITVVNTVSGSRFTLPNTGGAGLLPLRLLGTSLMAASAAAAVFLHKKRRSEGRRDRNLN